VTAGHLKYFLPEWIALPQLYHKFRSNRNTLGAGGGRGVALVCAREKEFRIRKIFGET